MSYDPNLNVGAGNSTSNLEIPGWCENEDSFDLTNFVSNNRNLELCNDDLFETLFPPNSPTLGLAEKDKTDKEVEHWSNQTHSGSHPASACSSAATSPALQTYYNTPPVTPRTEGHRATSPHHLQLDGLTTSMSSARLAMLRSSNGQPSQQSNFSARTNSERQVAIKQETNDVPASQLPFATSRSNMFQHHSDVVGFNRGNSGGFSVVDEQNNETVTNQLWGGGQQSNEVPAARKRHQSPSIPINIKKSKTLEKGSMEYMEKRRRNNIAVRHSRDKAKKKAQETQERVSELTNENHALRRRIAELTNELNTLKDLLTTLPQARAHNMG